MTYLYGEADKFINDIYWSELHDKGSRLNIPEVIDERLHKDNQDKDPEYYNHRPGVVHVSSLSKCLRGVAHEMLGTPKDERDKAEVARKLGVFKAGNLFEDFIVEALDEWMLDRQTEYVYDLGNGVILTGRDDGTIEYQGQLRMLECKSVHSDTFWHRQREGILVAPANQMQIQTYLWLRRILPNVFVTYNYTDDGVRINEKEIIYTNMTKQALWEYRGMKPDDVLRPMQKPDNSDLNGTFSYISKDDCTVIQAPVKFNMRIIEEVVKPALQIVTNAYLTQDPSQAPLPPLAVYDAGRGQWKKNYLCTYCDYHTKCAGAGWLAEAMSEVTRLNKQGIIANPHAVKPSKPLLYAVPSNSDNIDTVTPSPEPGAIVKGQVFGMDVAESGNQDKSVMVTGHREGDSIIVDTVTEIPPDIVLSPFPAPNTPISVTPLEGETTVERMLREHKEKSGL